MHKKSHPTFFVLAILFLALLHATSYTMYAYAIELTDLEKYYIETKGNISLCVDPDWVPFEKINDQQEHEGIAADLIKLVAERTGLHFTLHKTANWDQSLEDAQNHKCQVLSFLNKTSKRDEWLIFTEPLFTDFNVFITREEHPFISDPGGLTDQTVALPKGTSIEEVLRKNYPNLEIILTETESEALKLVSERKADMTLRSLIVAAYTIKKEGWFNLKIAGQLPDYSNKLRIGIVGKDLVLQDILNKGIATITGQDRGMIVNKHVSINVQTVPDYSLALKITGVLTLVTCLSALWVFQLKKHNKELARISQTDALTTLPNRLKLNTVLDAEHLRAMRNWRPLSVIILDLDNFKLVNDELGHITRDKVLKEIATILKSSIRVIDISGRWGGEEFLIICPETDIEGAKLVAERIINKVRKFNFSSNRKQTISAGIASLTEDETIETMIARADKSLYAAKTNGRDQFSSTFICADKLNT